MICTAAMQRSYEAYELLKKDSKDKVNILKHEGSDHIFTTIKTVFSPYLISKLLILCRSSLTHTSDAWKIPLCSCQHSLVCQEEASPLFPQKWAILVSPPFFYLPLLSYLVIRGKLFCAWFMPDYSNGSSLLGILGRVPLAFLWHLF